MGDFCQLRTCTIVHALQKNSFQQPRVLTVLKVENYFKSTTLLFTCRRNILFDSNNGKTSLFIVNLPLILRKALENIITTLCKPFPLICKQGIPFFEVFPNISYCKIALKSSPSFRPLWGNFACFFFYLWVPCWTSCCWLKQMKFCPIFFARYKNSPTSNFNQ